MKKKVLIVDDDKEFCEEVADALRYEGYNVETSYDGLDAAEKIDEADYDAVVLDLKLPGLSGTDLLKEIKENKKDLHVIVCSSQTDVIDNFKENSCDDDDECKILGTAHHVMSKPISISSLLAAIRKATNGHRKSK